MGRRVLVSIYPSYVRIDGARFEYSDLKESVEELKDLQFTYAISFV
jgi:hypothetical protein